MFILFRLLAIIMVLIAIAYKATTTTAKNTQKLKQKNRLSCSNIWQRGKSFFSFMLILSVTHLCIHLLRRIFEALQTCLPVVTRSNQFARKLALQWFGLTFRRKRFGRRARLIGCLSAKARTRLRDCPRTWIVKGTEETKACDWI